MADLANLVSIAAALAGVGAGTATYISAERASKRLREDLQRLDADMQNRALDSSDLAILGKYLLEDIGTVRVSDVVSDDQVRKRAWQAFSRVAQYVGEPDDADEGEGAAMTGQPRDLSSKELRTAREQVLAGEVWNGLALMRRHLEILLRQSDTSLESARMGAGQLISAAERVGALPPDVVPQLRYAVGVANRAIHGEPVDVGVALEALESADHALRRMAVQRDSPSASVD